MGVTGRIKIGRPGWMLAEGHAYAMEIFTRRIKNAHINQLEIKWESTKFLPVGLEKSPYAVIEAARLFPDGMQEVELEKFGQDLIDTGLGELLKIGTGLDFQHLHENKNGGMNIKTNGSGKL